MRSLKYQGGYANANKFLQMDEWAFQQYFAGAIVDEETGQAMEYRDLIKHPKHKNTWEISLANELGRLAQGIREVKGTNTILFLPKSEIPKDRLKEVTYGRIVVAYKPDKLEKNRALKQLTKDGLTDEIKAIKLLREVLLGEKEKPLPPNSINKEKLRQK